MLQSVGLQELDTTERLTATPPPGIRVKTSCARGGRAPRVELQERLRPPLALLPAGLVCGGHSCPWGVGMGVFRVHQLSYPL